MSTSPVNQVPKPNPGLVQIGSDGSLTSEEILRQKVAEERRRLEQLAGVEDKPVLRFLRPKEHLFTKDQREHTTLLFGGLTWKHEKLIQGALQALGYKCEPVMVPLGRARAARAPGWRRAVGVSFVFAERPDPEGRALLSQGRGGEHPELTSPAALPVRMASPPSRIASLH